MICKSCGKDNLPSSVFCTSCGAALTDESAADEAVRAKTAEEKTALPEAVTAEIVHDDTVPDKKPKSHMFAAVLTTLLLGNWILGIPAIVFAKECELAAKNGQWEIASRFSRRALDFLAIGSALSIALAAFIIMLAAASGRLVMF